MPSRVPALAEMGLTLMGFNALLVLEEWFLIVSAMDVFALQVQLGMGPTALHLAHLLLPSQMANAYALQE